MSFMGIKNNDIASTSSQAAKQLESAVESRKQSEAKRAVIFRMIANEADIPAIVDLARASHEESRFGYIPFSEEKVRKICLSVLSDPTRHGVMLAEKRNRFVGFAYCTVGEYHIGTDFLVATIHNINVLKSARQSLDGGRAALGLFNGVESWSRVRGARELLFHVTSGVGLPQTHKLAKRMRFGVIGASYAKKLV